MTIIDRVFKRGEPTAQPDSGSPMPGVYRALVWKEWREHRWRLASMTAILLAVNLAAWGSDNPTDFITPLIVTLALYLPLAPAFLALGTAAGERSGGTLEYLRSMPISLRKAAAIKLLFGILTALAPALLAIAFVTGLDALAEVLDWSGHPGDPNRHTVTGHWWADYSLMATGVTVSVVLWFAALGVNRESEVRVAAIGLLVVVTLWLGFAGVVAMIARYDFMRRFDWLPLFSFVTSALPAGAPFTIGSVITEERAMLLWTIVPTTLLVHGGLAYWYIARFGRTESANRFSPRSAAPKVAEKPAWLGAPMSSPFSALLWKHFRECLPVMLTGFVGAVAVASVLAYSVYRERANVLPDAEVAAAGGAAAVFAAFGFLAGLVTGVGAMTSDFAPGLENFWRSRPIQIDQWFWSKFLVALAMLGVGFILPSLVGFAAIHAYSGEAPPYSVLATSVLAFASALLTGALFRRPVYAAILGIGLMGVVYVPLLQRLEEHRIELWVMYATLAVTTVGFTLVAWVVSRKDWALAR